MGGQPKSECRGSSLPSSPPSRGRLSGGETGSLNAYGTCGKGWVTAALNLGMVDEYAFSTMVRGEHNANPSWSLVFYKKIYMLWNIIFTITKQHILLTKQDR